MKLKCLAITLLRSQSLEFDTILPDNPQEYDNLQPPKHRGTMGMIQIHIFAHPYSIFMHGHNLAGQGWGKPKPHMLSLSEVFLQIGQCKPTSCYTPEVLYLNRFKIEWLKPKFSTFEINN
ncbi:hypothetical protein CEXT_477491 [Caerostris extrusa]|uniref:Galectin n=1 Tax=Caerostris extrusa TaxID=172846 RepID=A0AAV4W5T7_CAEEX|nr:hypothetical protein CEXT_477491 [Caerostris extrusa]